MEAEGDGDEGGGVVQGGLHGVHIGPGEGSGVVGLVVEAVNLNVMQTYMFQLPQKVSLL